MRNQKSSTKSKSGLNKVVICDNIHNTMMCDWNAIQDNQDPSVLVKKGKASPEEIKAAWDRLFKSYIDEFGINDEYRNLLFKQRNLGYAMLEDMEESTPFSKSNLKRMQRSVEEHFAGKPKEKSGIAYAQIERYMYRELNPKKTTVYTFYNYYRLRKMEESAA